MREWMDEPQDERPVIAVCEECGQDIHGEDSTHYGDTFYDLPSLGCVHEDCLMEYLQQFKKGL